MFMPSLPQMAAYVLEKQYVAPASRSSKKSKNLRCSCDSTRQLDRMQMLFCSCSRTKTRTNNGAPPLTQIEQRIMCDANLLFNTMEPHARHQRHHNADVTRPSTQHGGRLAWQTTRRTDESSGTAYPRHRRRFRLFGARIEKTIEYFYRVPRETWKPKCLSQPSPGCGWLLT